MSKGFITGTNEELIKAYKESRDESYLKELIEANKGLINLLVSPYLTSIPNSELEDLTSESYIPMLRAIEDYDPEQGVAFSTLLKVYVRQHLNRLYNEATRQKRFTGTTPDSLDRLSEINKEGGTETDSTFKWMCPLDNDYTYGEITALRKSVATVKGTGLYSGITAEVHLRYIEKAMRGGGSVGSDCKKYSKRSITKAEL